MKHKDVERYRKVTFSIEWTHFLMDRDLFLCKWSDVYLAKFEFLDRFGQIFLLVKLILINSLMMQQIIDFRARDLFKI
jgi:hypothetical protein